MRFKLLALQGDYATLWLSAEILCRSVLFESRPAPASQSEEAKNSNNHTPRSNTADTCRLQRWLRGYEEDRENDDDIIGNEESYDFIVEILGCHHRTDHTITSPISLPMWNQLLTAVRRNVYSSSIESPLAVEYRSSTTTEERKQELFSMSGAFHELELLDCPDSYFLSMSYFGLLPSTHIYHHSCIPSHQLDSQLVVDDRDPPNGRRDSGFVPPVLLTVAVKISLCSIELDSTANTVSMIGDLVVEDYETRQEELSRRGMEGCNCLRCQFERSLANVDVENEPYGGVAGRGLESLLECAKQQERYEDALDIAQAMVTFASSSLEQHQHDSLNEDASALPKALFERARIAGWNSNFCQREEWLEQAIHQRRDSNIRHNVHWEAIEDALTEAQSYFHESPPSNSISVADSSDKEWVIIEDLDGMAFFQEAVLNADECAAMIRLVEQQHQEESWTTSRHYAIPTTDIPVYKIPALLEWFNRQLEQLIFPNVRKQFLEEECSSSNNELCDGSTALSLRVMDAFLVRYDYKIGQRRLPLHNDQSLYSLTIAMNPVGEYGGGGTFFAESGQTVKTDVGGIISFEGQLIHAGMTITRGTRYIIVCFVYVEEQQQRAPKCDNRASR